MSRAGTTIRLVALIYRPPFLEPTHTEGDSHAAFAVPETQRSFYVLTAAIPKH